ncbi:hypothetical protein PRIPAC_81345 [Pristionchus pacificus]|uniref:Uncharacterized protein n=1 Tax=Pristionchus pacificus TaxID=54126 RepID=A0A2A6CMT9_PRIPA|nr:hypothetical protein PRIPAC_81345 [Pristionchus pacificus]|eukprot:PDM79416.1 hypothetical protein PRIPAC_31995 [Pristionchus pacificus]
MERHQAVQTPGSRLRFSVITRRSMFLFIMINAIIIPILLKVGEMPADMERVVLQNLSHRWPLPVENADCFGPLTFTIFMPFTNVGMVISTLVIILAMIPLALLIFPMFCALVAVLALVGGPCETVTIWSAKSVTIQCRFRSVFCSCHFTH